MDCEYVRKTYGVPAKIGMRVIANFEKGTIVEDREQYIGVLLDKDKDDPTLVRNYHPTWNMQYEV